MKTYYIKRELAQQVIQAFHPEISTEWLATTTIQEIESILNGISENKDATYEIRESISPLELSINRLVEFPFKRFECVYEQDGKVKTYLTDDLARKITMENIGRFNAEQLATILEMLPQSKCRKYVIGAIPFDEDEWLERGNVLSETEDFNDANHRNIQEIRYFNEYPQ